MTEIKAYKGYTRNLLFNFSLKGIDSLDGYNAYFVVKRADNVSAKLIDESVPVVNNQASFEISASDNDIDEKEYVAAVYLSNGLKTYPAGKYIYKIENFI